MKLGAYLFNAGSRLHMNTATDQISDRGVFLTISFCITFIDPFHLHEHMKNLESPVQDQIAILIIPEEFPLYLDFLLYNSSFAERMRELKTALPLMSHMIFVTLG